MAKKKRLFDEDGNEVTKTKKPFYKRWWFIGLVVFFVLAAIGESDEESTESIEPETEEVEMVEEPEVEEPVEEVEAEEEVEEVAQEAEEVVEEIEEVEEEEFEVEESISPEDERMLKTYLALAMMENNFEGTATIDYDEENDAITILPTDPDFATAIVFLQTGDLPMDTWYELRDNYAYMSEELGKAVGEGIVISLLNPSNPDNTILSVVDGVIFYDAFD